MSPTLNRSSVMWHFEHGDVMEISDRMIFDFYKQLLTSILISLVAVVCTILKKSVLYSLYHLFSLGYCLIFHTLICRCTYRNGRQ